MDQILLSIIIPTLNSGERLTRCLTSLQQQIIPKHLIEILVIDGGSRDSTVTTAQQFGATVYSNPYRYAEPAKAIGIDKARGTYIAFIDDDNYFLDSMALIFLLIPLILDSEIFLSEPMYYAIDENLTPLQKYWALSGANDPICIAIGVHDKAPLDGSDKWQSLNIPTRDCGMYVKAQLMPPYIPTLGANAAVFRASVLKTLDNYSLLDIDRVACLVQTGFVSIAKVRVGVVHTFAATLTEYAAKCKRKSLNITSPNLFVVTDKVTPKGDVTRVFRYPLFLIWKFILSTVFLIPALIWSARRWSKQQHIEWFYHLPVSLITLLYYSRALVFRYYNTLIVDYRIE